MIEAPFQLRVGTLESALAVASFQGRERVSDAYRFDITALSESDTDDVSTLLDQPATLTLFDNGLPIRHVFGIVWRAEELGSFDKNRRGLRVRLVPKAQRLRLRRQRRIFQDRTTLEIAAILCAEHRVLVRPLVRRASPIRPYAVQYDESDWQFLRRLLAEEGYFFFFDHPLHGLEETLVIADAPQDQAPIDGLPTLRFERLAENAALTPREDQVTEFAAANQLRTESTVLRGYDFTRPDAPPQSVAALSEQRFFAEHEGNYEADLGPRPAAVRLEQMRVKAFRASGRSLCKRLAPGRSFVLQGHDSPTLDRAWAVTSVSQVGKTPLVGNERDMVWSCRFEAVDAATSPRMPWKGARPRQVAETAIVVGPPGQEVHTDASGRIKVQFHWDRSGVWDEKSSCFVRVSQSWAGPGWGTQMLPRIGMEVVVTFLGGDPDRPLVTGCVVNATHPPPFPLPNEVTKSGLRSKTFGGDGFNELSVDDTPGGEKIYVRAERDFLQETENNYTSHVRGGRLSTVAQDSTDRVEGSSVFQVEGSRTTTIKADDELTVSGNVRRVFDQAETKEVNGTSSVRILGRHVLDVRDGRLVIVGSEQTPSADSLVVYGPASTQATGEISARSDEGILLSCGESSIQIKKDKIVFYTPTLELRATKELIATAKDGPTMTLGDDVEILSKKLRVFTDGAALELDQDAKIDGAQIKLGYDPSKPDKSNDEKEPETVPLQVKMSDYFLEPYAHKHYHLLVGGQRIEGETDGDGMVKADIPKTATQATVRLWIDDYPEGRQTTYNLQMKGEPAALNTVMGAKWRLTNLGYYSGPQDGTEGPDYRDAIQQFQADHHDSHGLDPTGEYDEGTQGALEEVHGS
ncbi:MAG: type VI secretion system tip protein VgrG [Polyangiaceae bacterium]|nr:type VI secretion system tip protein VgrG [Polyangiaceae bacterium]